MEAWFESLFVTHVPYPDIFFRLILAAGFGMLLGLDRELRNHEAGLRTHMLVSLAAAGFTLVTIEMAYMAAGQGDAARADTLRVVEAVTTGVAFLGAGAIIRRGGDVKGLTTGASMWLAGAIGIAAGAGFYGIGLAVTLLGVFILSVVSLIERYTTKRDEYPKEDRPEDK